jgi:hypothetical protein
LDDLESKDPNEVSLDVIILQNQEARLDKS